METADYIQNRIHTNVRKFEELSKKYHRCHIDCLFLLLVVLQVF